MFCENIRLSMEDYFYIVIRVFKEVVNLQIIQLIYC